MSRSLTLRATGYAAALGAAAAMTGAVHAQQGGSAVATTRTGTAYVSIDRSIPGSGTRWMLHLVPTRDELYVPIGVRKPEGDGPFPMILIGSGQGRDGIGKIEEAMQSYEGLMARLLEQDYAAAFVNYRNEVPELYNQIERPELLADDVSGGNRTLQSVPSLDSDDYISIVEHVQGLPFVAPNAIGSIGSSHSGEIILKTTALIDLGAGVPSEAAALEFLGIDAAEAPRDASGRELQLQDIEVVRSLADKEAAMRRIRQIETPLLILGRDDDHLQGIFELVHEWAVEAERDVTWASFDHPEHGYSLLRQEPGERFAPDALQEQAFALYMRFFDEHLKSADQAVSLAQ